MTNFSKSRRLTVSFAVFAVTAFLGGCGDKPEQNPFTTPQREPSDPIGLTGDLLQSFPAYSEAKEAMDREDWDVAAGILQSLLDGPDPQAAFANDLAIVEIRRGNFQAALKACSKAITLDPQYERAYFNKGTVLAELDRRQEAIKAYKSAVDLNDFYYEAWYNLGLLYYKKGDLSSSRKAFLSITERTRSSRFNKAHYQLGLIAADRGNDQQAVEHYSQSILLDPSHVPSYINKATALMRFGKLNQSAEFLRKACALDPESYLAFYNLGLVLRRLERFEESSQAYETAVSLKPGAKKAWLNLGYVRAFLGDSEGARKAFMKALEIDPGYESAERALNNLLAGKIVP